METEKMYLQGIYQHQFSFYLSHFNTSSTPSSSVLQYLYCHTCQLGFVTGKDFHTSTYRSCTIKQAIQRHQLFPCSCSQRAVLITRINCLVLFPANKPASHISFQVLHHQTGHSHQFPLVLPTTS